VRQAFFALLAQQRRGEVLSDMAKDLERVRQVVVERASVGESSKYELARIDLEAGTLRVERAAATADEAQANGALAVAVGQPGAVFHAVGTLEPQLAPDVAALEAKLDTRRPSLKQAEGRVAAAQASVALARREAIPVPSLNAGVQVTREVNGVSATVGLSIPLPAFDRNQGPVARAQAQVSLEERQLDAERQEAHAELERAAAQLGARRAARELYGQQVAQHLSELRQMADDAYRGGKGDILELLDAYRSFKDARLLEVEQDEAVKQAEAQLIAAAGVDEP